MKNRPAAKKEGFSHRLDRSVNRGDRPKAVERDRAPAASRRRHFGSASRRIAEVCFDASTTAELIEGLRAPLNDALGLSGMLLSATDPETTALGTATVVEHIPEEISIPWMHNEYLEDDFNKFAVLHRSRAATTTLDRATQSCPHLSPRHRFLHQPYGLGHELRTTFSEGTACWGVANLVRQAGDRDFEDEALEWIENLRPTIAAAIRRTTGTAVHTPGAEEGPGIVTIDTAGTVHSMTSAAACMLADLWLCPFVEDSVHRLPGEAYMIATLARARALAAPEEREQIPPPVARLQGRSGRWLTIRGDHAKAVDGGLSGIVLIIRSSRPAEILPFTVAACGLTGREQEVLAELAGGNGTKEIADRLFISEHTVRDHVKSILAKTKTSSRGELISRLFREGESPSLN